MPLAFQPFNLLPHESKTFEFALAIPDGCGYLKYVAKAKGEWLFWLNADDVLLPGALKKVREFISRVELVDRVDWIAGDTV